MNLHYLQVLLTMWSIRTQRGVLTVAVGCWCFCLLKAQSASKEGNTNNLMHCDELCDFSSWAMHAYCGERGLTDIPLICSQVKTLDVRLNNINVLLRGRLSKFHDLKYLYLVNNGMSEVETGAFESCDGIQFLSWGNNDFQIVRKHVLQGLSSLMYLLMGHSKIRRIEPEAFGETPLLKTLDLTGNDLVAPPCDAVTDENVITDLYLSDNRISILPEGCFARYKHLKRLKLDNNPLRAIANNSAFQGLDNLLKLELDNASLITIPVDAFRHVNTVDHVILSRNLIESLEERDFANLPMVEVLNLEYNRIRTIHQRAFDYLLKLRVLVLSHNQIVSIEHHAFLSVETSLEELHIHGNNLSSIHNISSSTIYSLQKLPIAGNPLKCHCHLWHYRDWMEKGQESLDELHLSATCEAPSGEVVYITQSIQTESRCLIQTTPPARYRLTKQESQLNIDQTLINPARAQHDNNDVPTESSEIDGNDASSSSNLPVAIMIALTIGFTFILCVGTVICFNLKRRRTKEKKSHGGSEYSDVYCEIQQI